MTRVIGIVGWKDVGKTYLVTEIIKLLVAKNYRVGSIKHAHDDFDIDKPGTDSFKHRESGSSQVIISSSRRWAKINENIDNREKSLKELVEEFENIDIIIVEGFKNEIHPKIEIIANNLEISNSKIKNVIAIVSDVMLNSNTPVFKKNEIKSLVEFIIKKIL